MSRKFGPKRTVRSQIAHDRTVRSQIAHDRTVIEKSSNFKLLNRNIRGSDSRSVKSYTILGISRTTYFNWETIQRSEPIEPRYRTICENPFDSQTMSELRSTKSYVLVTTRRSHWDNNAPLLQCPHAETRAGSLRVSKAIKLRRKISKLQATLPATGSTRRVEHFIQLHPSPIRTASGRNRGRKLTV
ncbi:hypothetical protein L3X38_009270 [Prunus dulcis]|uniref:Uncharacterized protein n=1 Tax=Prunus dulcis TaxID=3755 RepID=A0AAD5F843_PRUDU|nr:hypothetical protein L3X38_009270 [Prunus dulcis]